MSMPASLSSFETDCRNSAKAFSACCFRSLLVPVAPSVAAAAVRAESSWLPAAAHKNKNGLLVSPEPPDREE